MPRESGRRSSSVVDAAGGSITVESGKEGGQTPTTGVRPVRAATDGMTGPNVASLVLRCRQGRCSDGLVATEAAVRLRGVGVEVVFTFNTCVNFFGFRCDVLDSV